MIYFLTDHKYFHHHLFTYLFWQSLVCHPIRHNVTALLVNMVFSDKDKITITNLYQLNWYNAKQLRSRIEFPDKDWTPINTNRLLKKFRDKSTVDKATQLHHRTGSFPNYSHFSEVNKYAFKIQKLVVLFIISSFSSNERIVKIG